MNHIRACLLYSLFSFLLASCGLERNYGNDNISTEVGTQLVQAPRDLTTFEESIATRICYAYRNKRLNFSNIHLGESYNFVEVTNNCTSTESSKEVSGELTLNGNRLFFNGAVNFSVETDTDGYLAAICSKLTTGKKAQNVVNINGEMIFYTFDTKNGLDSYAIQIALAEPLSTNNIIRIAHEYDVITSGNNSSTLGLVKTYKRSSLCSNPTITNVMTRSYTGAQ